MKFNKTNLLIYSINVFISEYKSKYLGLFWLPFSNLIFILFISYTFSYIQKSSALFHFIYLSFGYIPWIYISGIITGSPKIFFTYKSLLLTGAFSTDEIKFIYLTRMLFIFALSAPLILLSIVISLYFQKFNLTNILFFPIVITVYFIASRYLISILSIINIFSRDLEEFLNALIRISFVVTPIMWIRETNFKLEVFDFNIFYHFIIIFRSLFMSEQFPIKSLLISIIITFILFIISKFLENKYKDRIVNSL